MEKVSIPIGQIVIDPTLQPRVDGIDPDHVRALEAVAEHWPALQVVRRDQQYILIDGFHRYAAAQNLKLNTVPVTIYKASEGEDLYELAFTLNAAHGRPLNLSDRRAFAARLLRAKPESSDREIGRRCGLTQPTVAKVRQDLEQQAHIQPAETRVGRDGRSYSTTPKAAGTASLGSLVENLADIFAPAERKAQRRFVRYLEKLAVVLDEQHSIESFENFENAANACRAVLGDDQAKELAESLGPASWNILQIAQALGYSGDGQ